MTNNIGEPAPSFVLKDTDLQDVNLEDYRGQNVVLVFYPLAFSGTCTTQMCMLKDHLSAFNSLDAKVFGISVDSPFTLKKFKEENQFEFPLLSDFNKEVSKAYNAFYTEFVLGLKGVAKRAVFVIDKEGKIQYQEILENAKNLPNFDALELEVSKLS
jgi:peroxiredoxin